MIFPWYVYTGRLYFVTKSKHIMKTYRLTKVHFGHTVDIPQKAIIPERLRSERSQLLPSRHMGKMLPPDGMSAKCIENARES